MNSIHVLLVLLAVTTIAAAFIGYGLIENNGGQATDKAEIESLDINDVSCSDSTGSRSSSSQLKQPVRFDTSIVSESDPSEISYRVEEIRERDYRVYVNTSDHKGERSQILSDASCDGKYAINYDVSTFIPRGDGPFRVSLYNNGEYSACVHANYDRSCDELS